MRFDSFAKLVFHALLLVAYVAPASHARLLDIFDEWIRPETTTRRPLDRSLEEEDCASLLRPHIQKVALMFLVRGDIYHEDVWTEWIGDVADVVPASLVCDEALAKCHRELPQGRDPPKSVYDQQFYYSIVVHTKPEYPGYESGSIFDGRIVDERIETAWGGHSLVAATRLLMKAALEDPYNQRFQLVCEATVPVRAPLFTHDQLLAQNMSRIGYPGMMFGGLTDSASRWPLAMHEGWPELKYHVRFHRQWVTLIRDHAQIVVDDTFVIGLFERHCYIASEKHKLWCISDEQYIGTLLSWKLGDRLEYEYSHDLAMALVAGGPGIPGKDIDAELLQIRGSTRNLSHIPHYEDHRGECHAVEKPSISHMEVNHEGNPYQCEHNPRLRESPLYRDVRLFEHCAFFARKFSAPTAPAVKQLLRDLLII